MQAKGICSECKDIKTLGDSCPNESNPNCLLSKRQDSLNKIKEDNISPNDKEPIKNHIEDGKDTFGV